MSKVLVSESILDDTASALQRMLGTDDKFTPTQFASGIESIPQSSAVEITDNNSASLSKYTNTELAIMGKTNKGFTYQGRPILGFKVSGMDNDWLFIFTSLGSNNYLITTRAYVDTQKRIVIDWSSEATVATVNYVDSKIGVDSNGYYFTT